MIPNFPGCPKMLSLRNILVDWQRLGIGEVKTELKDAINKQ